MATTEEHFEKNEIVDEIVQQNRTIAGKQAFIDAFRKSLGNITHACQASGVSRSIYYEWIKVDSEFKKEVESVAEEKLDFIESKLAELITGVIVEKEGPDGPRVYQRPPDNTSIIFALKTQGKRRGYYEKTGHENTVKNAEGEKFKIEIDAKTAPIEQIDDALNTLLQ